VRRLGGEIAVESKPGAGTLFLVRLPIVNGAEVKPTVERSASASAVSLRDVRILIADDEASVRSTMRRMLERRGAAVVLASDGADAAARLRDGAFQLVVLDVMMPKLTGYQLLPIARQSQPRAHIMLMSGYAEAVRGPRGTAEPDAFLEKPFTGKQLDAAIDGLLRRQRR
jgi:CheY-like chemotaxis protein